LVVGIVLAVVVLVGAGIGAYYVFFRSGGQQSVANSDPQEVVSGFAAAYTSLAHTLSSADLARVKGYLCTADQQAMQVIYDHQKSLNSTDRSFSMRTSGLATDGDRGTFQFVITDQGTASRPRTGKLVRQNQSWLVCDTVAAPR
jgi:hypothetical protein